MKDLDTPFERIAYRSGQTLRAADLRDDQEQGARRRRLHNRLLHGTWGIAVGLQATLNESRTVVTIEPGYAIDQDGRDVVVARTRHLHIPEGPELERFVLTARDADVRRCVRCGAVVAWRRVEAVDPGVEVILTAVQVRQGKAHGPLDLSVRRGAQPQRRPRIGQGATSPGRGGWRSWSKADHLLGLEIEVDTRAADFSTTPVYFAALQAGERPGPDLPGDGTTFITEATPTHFVYRVLGGVAPFDDAITPEQAEKRGWSVRWSGTERTAQEDDGVES